MADMSDHRARSSLQHATVAKLLPQELAKMTKTQIWKAFRTNFTTTMVPGDEYKGTCSKKYEIKSICYENRAGTVVFTKLISRNTITIQPMPNWNMNTCTLYHPTRRRYIREPKRFSIAVLVKTVERISPVKITEGRMEGKFCQVEKL